MKRGYEVTVLDVLVVIAAVWVLIWCWRGLASLAGIVSGGF